MLHHTAETLDKLDILSPDEGVVYLCTTQYASTYINTFEVLRHLIISMAAYKWSFEYITFC